MPFGRSLNTFSLPANFSAGDAFTMAIYRPVMYPPSMMKRPIKHWGLTLAVSVVIAVIYFPIFLFVVKAALGNWKELSSLAFYKAVVAPAALIVLAIFAFLCIVIILFYFSECFTARLYERFGRAHVICIYPEPKTFSDILKHCLVFVHYAVDGVAAAIPLLKSSEAEFLVLFMLTRKCAHKPEADASCPIQCEKQMIKDKHFTIV
ncbi:hypothetical protein COCOBI_11-2040 [Coccomyxa sp. Obi]|nr:hypothetical protein COCOBI_11-2040 [Coccomyxa sp. Obi]